MGRLLQFRADVEAVLFRKQRLDQGEIGLEPVEGFDAGQAVLGNGDFKAGFPVAAAD